MSPFKPTSGLPASLRRSATAAERPSMGVPPAETVPEEMPPPTIPVSHDDAFLHMMIENHKQALKIAHVQVANGKRPDVRRAAESLIIQHNTEIERLKKLRG